MIVKMLHLDLVCTAASSDATLERLRALGAVHLDLASAVSAAVDAAQGEIADAERAVRLIAKARGAANDIERRYRSVKEVLELDADREKMKSELDGIERDIRTYEPYGDFDPALARTLLDRGIDLSDKLPAVLPEMRLSAMVDRRAKLADRISIADAKIAASDDEAILAAYPALRDKMAFEQARGLLETRGAIAGVSGWVPEPRAGELRAAAVECGWGYLLREPEEGEAPPTLIEPPRLFRPVKVLFDGLGIAPAYSEADVSVPFMCYFSLFFAMLVGDGAYGAIFLAGTLALRKKLPKSWFTLLAVFSAATIAWGLLSNTWFGASIPWCADWPTVKWLADPSYSNMMLLCFTIGVSHLMLARIWNGVCRAPDSTALAEFGWAGVLLFMYFVTNSIVGIFASIPTAIYWVFGVSLLSVFLFTVKPSELKTRGAELGMLPLNVMSALGDIISYVRLFAVGLASVKVAENFNSMATGLLTGADAMWEKALMSVAMVAILVVGHGLNLVMAGLSILVHAVRLNTLEFSNHKGVSWSGYAYSPFRSQSAATEAISTRYGNIKKEENQ